MVLLDHGVVKKDESIFQVTTILLLPPIENGDKDSFVSQTMIYLNASSFLTQGQSYAVLRNRTTLSSKLANI